MRRAIIGILLLGAMGCEPKNDTTSSAGEQGRVGFSYARSCFFGCPVEQPLLTGTRERIEVTNSGDAERVTVSSSDEDIATFALERDCVCERDDFGGTLEVALSGVCPHPWEKKCDNHVLVQALAAGDVELALQDAEGDMLDNITLHVRDAVSAAFFAVYDDRLGKRGGDSFELDADATMQLSVELYDESGLGILAPEGVHWTSSDGDVAEISGFLVAPSVELDGNREVVVEARGQGTAQIGIDVPGLQAAVDVTVSAP